MPAAYVKPYVKRGKNDATDAEAICEAVTRQTMRFVPIKSREQQAAPSPHRVRSLLIRQRTQLINMMRSVLAELGIAIPVGIEKALQLARRIVDGEIDLDLPAEAAGIITMLSEQILQLHVKLRKLDFRLAALQRSNETARRLATIPGIGPVCATAIAASVTHPGQFAPGRQFAAWLGLTPRQNSNVCRIAWACAVGKDQSAQLVSLQRRRSGG
jgi:transposase